MHPRKFNGYFGDNMNVNTNDDDLKQATNNKTPATTKKRLEITIPECIESSKVAETLGTSSSQVHRVRVVDDEMKWSTPMVTEDEVLKGTPTTYQLYFTIQ
ncbi:hypothetical protein PanWU01x14_099080 [Parasponia andersonii]|uniref:Uncharacterized protein n=1 Tax=Parasponia andersonii TaxID=3476 RepID=A0A2P5D3Q8_PARAD|nr:hypothetical protein PanWU01x14_099080 [Parasponia andersonii]